MNSEFKEIIDFWCDTNRFLEYASCTDPLVANNMAQNICNTYKDKESIPLAIRNALTSHLLGKFGDLQTNIQFIKNCQGDIFAQILFQIYPKFKADASSCPTITPRFTKSTPIDNDPFENLPENTIRTVTNAEKGEIIVAATTERIINILTGSLCGKLFFLIILFFSFINFLKRS